MTFQLLATSLRMTSTVCLVQRNMSINQLLKHVESFQLISITKRGLRTPASVFLDYAAGRLTGRRNKSNIYTYSTNHGFLGGKIEVGRHLIVFKKDLLHLFLYKAQEKSNFRLLLFILCSLLLLELPLINGKINEVSLSFVQGQTLMSCFKGRSITDERSQS